MESVVVDDWDLIVVRIKNLHRIKMVELEESLGQSLIVEINEK